MIKKKSLDLKYSNLQTLLEGDESNESSNKG